MNSIFRTFVAVLYYAIMIATISSVIPFCRYIVCPNIDNRLCQLILTVAYFFSSIFAINVISNFVRNKRN